MLALAVLAALPQWQFIYRSRMHDLVFLTDGHVLRREKDQIQVATLDHLLSADELKLFERSADLFGCKVPEFSLRSAKRQLSFCRFEQIRPPALARMFARLEAFVPAKLQPWTPTHYLVRFANLRRKGKVTEEGVPLTWPPALPYPQIAPMGASHSSVLVEAGLLPELKRYREADPAAEISWSPALPGIDDL